jgi:hypothetical protein
MLAFDVFTGCLHIISIEKYEGPSQTLTLLPLNTNDKRHMAVNGILGEDSRCCLNSASQADLRVDIERQCSSTGRPDGGSEWDFVSDCIVTIDRALESGLGGSGG